MFAGVRKESDLSSWSNANNNVVPILLDVTKQEDVDAARQLVEGAVGPSGLTAVINNAAYALWSPVECVAPDTLQQVRCCTPMRLPLVTP